ncbi:MAG: DsbA family oxidoreductase [Pyrinomonadaceae bacterium]
MKKLSVEIWSDIACPWCYVGKRRFEAALAAFPQRATVEIVWRAFELDPAAPRALPEGLSYAVRLAKKYGTSAAQAEGMIQRMTQVAAADGLDFRFDLIRSGNTFDAHQLLQLAARQGPQDADARHGSLHRELIFRSRSHRCRHVRISTQISTNSLSLSFTASSN